MPTDFHAERKAWSQIKHRILGSYLSLFLGKLGGRGDHVYYVDGFAGQGRYDDGQDGSPLIVADIAANPTQTSRVGVLKCINVEADENTFQNLERATAPYAEQGIVKNYHARLEDVLPSILQDIGESTAFFFIDPFGTEGAELSTLETIKKRRGKTEVLVRYDDTRVHRLIQWSQSNIERWWEPKFQKTAQAFVPRIAGLTDQNAIAAVVRKDPEARQCLIDGYLNLVKSRRLFRYGLSYPIRNPETGGHHYFLVHFCDFADGYTYMANFMARVERTARDQAVDLFAGGEQMQLLAINEQVAKQVRDANVAAIVEAIPALLRKHRLAGRTVQLRQLLAAVVDQFQWQYTRNEWMAALRAPETQRALKLSGSKDGDNVVIYRQPA